MGEKKQPRTNGRNHTKGEAIRKRTSPAPKAPPREKRGIRKDPHKRSHQKKGKKKKTKGQTETSGGRNKYHYLEG